MPQLPPLGDPHNAIELRILFFTASSMSEKMRYCITIHFSSVVSIDFTLQCDIYFWCFISGLPMYIYDSDLTISKKEQ